MRDVDVEGLDVEGDVQGDVEGGVGSKGCRQGGVKGAGL